MICIRCGKVMLPGSRAWAGKNAHGKFVLSCGICMDDEIDREEWSEWDLMRLYPEGSWVRVLRRGSRARGAMT